MELIERALHRKCTEISNVEMRVDKEKRTFTVELLLLTFINKE